MRREENIGEEERRGESKRKWNKRIGERNEVSEMKGWKKKLKLS